MIEFHRLLLGDKIRNQAFERALKKLIVPGKTTVADIGSGTGYLSFLARKLGAAECYLYESDDIITLSKKIAEKNSIEAEAKPAVGHNLAHCHFFHKHSTQEKNPPKVDLVISETLGNFAYEENIIENMRDARRFLRPGGKIVPERLKNFVAPVTNPRLFNELNVWDSLGFDFSEAKKLCMNNMYVKKIEPEDLLPNAAQQWDAIDFSQKNSSLRSADIRWEAKDRGIGICRGGRGKRRGQGEEDGGRGRGRRGCDVSDTIYGFALWWECELIPGVVLSTSPYTARTHWDQIYLPLVEPISIDRNESLTLKIRSDSRLAVGIRVQWTLIKNGAIT